MKQRILVFTLIALVSLSFWNCSESSSPANVEVEEELSGLAIIRKKCIACHAETGKGYPSAPGFEEVALSYQKAFQDYTVFEDRIIKFLSSPSGAELLVENAEKRYGRMSKISLSLKEKKAIAKFLYGEELGMREEHSETGMDKAVNEAQLLLGSNLKKALKEHGPEGALVFCNNNAMQLTEQAERESAYSIKRVSLKNRNPLNAPTIEEKDVLEEFERLVVKAQKLNPMFKTVDGSKVGYYPILTASLCLNCHGDRNQFSDSLEILLNERYPNDLATGYKEGDLRGMWVVSE